MNLQDKMPDERLLSAVYPRIYADFQKTGHYVADDGRGSLQLTCAGTWKDLEHLGISLEEGMVVHFYDPDLDEHGNPDSLEVMGTLHYLSEREHWVGVITWDDIRYESENAILRGGAPRGPVARLPLSSRPRMFADFQKIGFYAPGYCDGERTSVIGLSCAGTRRDLDRLGIELYVGMEAIFYESDSNDDGEPDDLEVSGIVRYDYQRNHWVGVVIWDDIRYASENAKLRKPHSS